jgi:sterol desaturase/sphingolipid hydroxylase (fatty acid hydroxylase superfamily)
MKMSKLGYFSEFLLFPPLVLIATILALRHASLSQDAAWATIYVVGIAGWTLIEYFLHRVFFHHAPLLSQIHERHHDLPQELIGTPAWTSALLGLIVVAIPSCAILGFDRGTAITAGLVTGYLWYVFVHYAVHHWQPRPGSYLYRVRFRHAQHHYFSESGNFGVTTDVWDQVFGTALNAGARRARSTALPPAP